MLQPFITIGIPTWNRATYLKKNLDSLIEQIISNHLGQLVEVLVSDNDSNDETQIACESLAIQHSFINYHRQSHNRGANANFQYVLENAKGEYIWLFGDDDLVVPNVIKTVIQDIQRYSPDVVIGPSILDETKEKFTPHAFRKLALTHRNILSQHDLIDFTGKMSGLIFKRLSVLPILTMAEPIIIQTRTPWPHLAWLILLLNNANHKVLVLPYGINMIVAAHWHNLIYDGKTLLNILFIEYQALLIALKPHLDPVLFNELIRTSISTRQINLLKCVLYGTYINGYWDFMLFAGKAFYRIKGIKNKANYFLFLFSPLVLPTIFRKMIYHVVRKRWLKLDVTIKRINQAKDILANTSADRREFNEQQL